MRRRAFEPRDRGLHLAHIRLQPVEPRIRTLLGPLEPRIHPLFRPLEARIHPLLEPREPCVRLQFRPLESRIHPLLGTLEPRIHPRDHPPEAGGQPQQRGRDGHHHRHQLDRHGHLLIVVLLAQNVRIQSGTIAGESDGTGNGETPATDTVAAGGVRPTK